MRIDSFINRLAFRIFGSDSRQEPRVHFHSQNLNEDNKGNVKGLPWEGRLWLRFNGKSALHFSWSLWTHFCGVSVKACSEDGGTQFHWAMPPVSFWVTLPVFKKYMGYSHKSVIDISVHDWALWWQFGGDSMSWSSKTPKWKNGNFNLQNFLLGRTKHYDEVLELKDVLIPMPEGLYPAKAKMVKGVWKRPRWFAEVQTSIWLDIPKGIPHQGKGENDYDCGQDGLFGCGVDGESYEKAIAHAVEIVLKNRRNYDGNMNASYPNPSTC